MAKYQLTQDGVLDTETGANIPTVEDNKDWVAYLQWVADGNTPDPDPTDYLLRAKTDKINAIWGEADNRIDTIGAEFGAHATDVNYPAKAKSIVHKITRIQNKKIKSQNTTAAEDALLDAYDSFLDWADTVYDAADLGEDAVEASSTIQEVQDVTVTWPPYI